MALAAMLPLFFAVASCNLAHAFGGPKATWLDLYGGWASQNGGHLYMRCHTGKPPLADNAHENAAEKLLHSVEQLELDAARGANVAIIIQPNGSFPATADDHGFIDFKLPTGLNGPLNRVSASIVASKEFKASAGLASGIFG